jgi:lysyl-tRNA synthetase class 2
MDLRGDLGLSSMREAAARAGVAVPPAMLTDAAATFTWLLDAVQPQLGRARPTFLVDWPAHLTTSAPESGGVATRSELFIAGVEIADGFPFLCDAGAQRAAFLEANARRRASGKAPVDIDEAFLAALEEGLPPGAGMAMGVDRLLMVLLQATSIRDVLAFAADEL